VAITAVTKKWTRNVADERDWQYECTMRLFGWVRRSAKWGREVRRFRQASVWVPKKNKKSPTLAAWGLYLLCGDGEPGQKVFLAAKDGMQARKIAGEARRRHAPAVRGPDGRVRPEPQHDAGHAQPSRSWLEPLSSQQPDAGEQGGAERQSVLIDETHVVDRDFVRRISRAGISRSEPLHIEVSTAGNNPDSYGKERFDYASGRAGRDEDQELFVAIYAAPQDLTDADLDADPAKFGRMANPAWGHTVDPEEYLPTTRSRSGRIQDAARLQDVPAGHLAADEPTRG
jgi:phage terminase large subunit-like protein